MSAATATAVPQYSFGDELASSVIHGIGILLSIAGLAALVAVAALHGHALSVMASAVFGSTLILCYTASTLYHAIPGLKAKRVLRTFDHIAIFLLIAGSYTPFTLVAMPGVWGWSLFSAVWALALLGSALELGLLKRNRWMAVSLYVLMGWVGIIAFKPLMESLSFGGMALLIGGGLAYTAGVPFYLWRSFRYHHSIWHLFVLTGSVLHYLAVLLYVIPDASV